MTVIWKYPLRLMDEQIVTLYEHARILSVHGQRDVVTLWAAVNPDQPSRDWWVWIVPTGCRIPVGATAGDFVATVLVEEGEIVWHVFARPTL